MPEKNMRVNTNLCFLGLIVTVLPGIILRMIILITSHSVSIIVENCMIVVSFFISAVIFYYALYKDNQGDIIKNQETQNQIVIQSYKGQRQIFFISTFLLFLPLSMFYERYFFRGILDIYQSIHIALCIIIFVLSGICYYVLTIFLLQIHSTNTTFSNILYKFKQTIKKLKINILYSIIEFLLFMSIYFIIIVTFYLTKLWEIPLEISPLMKYLICVLINVCVMFGCIVLLFNKMIKQHNISEQPATENKNDNNGSLSILFYTSIFITLVSLFSPFFIRAQLAELEYIDVVGKKFNDDGAKFDELEMYNASSIYYRTAYTTYRGTELYAKYQYELMTAEENTTPELKAAYDMMITFYARNPWNCYRQHSLYYYLSGLSHKSNKNIQSAINDFEQALKYDTCTEFSNIYFELLELYIASGDAYKEKAKALKETIIGLENPLLYKKISHENSRTLKKATKRFGEKQKDAFDNTHIFLKGYYTCGYYQKCIAYLNRYVVAGLPMNDELDILMAESAIMINSDDFRHSFSGVYDACDRIIERGTMEKEEALDFKYAMLYAINEYDTLKEMCYEMYSMNPKDPKWAERYMFTMIDLNEGSKWKDEYKPILELSKELCESNPDMWYPVFVSGFLNLKNNNTVVGLANFEKLYNLVESYETLPLEAEKYLDLLADEFAYMMLNEDTGRISLLERYKDTSDYVYYYTMGQYYWKKNDYMKAINQLEKIEHLGNTYTLIYYDLGSLYCGLGYADKENKDNKYKFIALGYFEKVVELEPDNAYCWYIISTLYDMLGMYEASYTALENTCELMPVGTDHDIDKLGVQIHAQAKLDAMHAILRK